MARRKADELAPAARGAVFQLYQEGPGPDQVLQLCYMRKHPPRAQHKRVESAFVLPRPTLDVASVLPPLDVSLQQLQDATQHKTLSSDAVLHTHVDLAPAKQSARLHFQQPRQAEPDEIRQWSQLTARDWLDVWRPEDTSEVDDVCWLLERCTSDALATFVWDHLLVPLLRKCPTSSVGAAYERLLALLVAQHSLAALSPKDFRAKVRARQLRQVNDVLGAQAELLLVSLYRRQRGR